MRGIKIVDISRVLAGPWATQQLADQGATVIKVEPPCGDETRQFGPFYKDTSTYYLCANRNKRAIAIDLKQEDGRAVLDRLLVDADVLVENFRPGIAERLGARWETLHEKHPKLIYVAIHAFGENTPAVWRDRPGYDLVLQAMGGAMASTGMPGGPPLKCANSIADISAGMMAVQAILTGLLHRERTGETQKIVVNMMQVQASVAAYHTTRHTLRNEVDGQRGNSHAALAPYNVYRCVDGWIAIAVGNDKIWLRLLNALQVPPNHAWATNPQRVANRTAVDDMVSHALASRTVQDTDDLMRSAGVPAGPVNNYGNLVDHPAVQCVSTEHTDVGTLKMVGPALKTSTTRMTHTPPPKLSEHADEVLISLGYSQAERERLYTNGTVTRP